jgi:hypothetical protein
MALRTSSRSFPPSRWQLPSLLALYAVCKTSAIQPFRAIDVLNQFESSGHVLVSGNHSGNQGIGSSRKSKVTSSDNEEVQELYLEQLLDHFSQEEGASNGTFRQKYFYSSRHAQAITRPNAPVYAFLCVGGEGPSLDESVLIDSVHCSGDMLELARKLHEGQQAIVHLFALEHRYYGSSYPGRFIAESTWIHDSPL